MTDLEILKQKLNEQKGYMHFNGIEVTKLEPGYCEARAPMGEEKLNPHGFAHGGYLFTLCDTVAGIAASTGGRGVVGRSADVHYLRPAGGEYITARARVVRQGRNMAFATVELFDDAGRLAATAGVDMFFVGQPLAD